MKCSQGYLPAEASAQAGTLQVLTTLRFALVYAAIPHTGLNVVLKSKEDFLIAIGVINALLLPIWFPLLVMSFLSCQTRVKDLIQFVSGVIILCYSIHAGLHRGFI
jgi:hypothetical protein